MSKDAFRKWHVARYGANPEEWMRYTEKELEACSEYFRALGSREMKGEAQAIVRERLRVKVSAKEICAAIEAIPEEVGEEG